MALRGLRWIAQNRVCFGFFSLSLSILHAACSWAVLPGWQGRGQTTGAGCGERRGRARRARSASVFAASQRREALPIRPLIALNSSRDCIAAAFAFPPSFSRAASPRPELAFLAEDRHQMGEGLGHQYGRESETDNVGNQRLAMRSRWRVQSRDCIRENESGKAK